MKSVSEQEEIEIYLTQNYCRRESFEKNVLKGILPKELDNILKEILDKKPEKFHSNILDISSHDGNAFVMCSMNPYSVFLKFAFRPNDISIIALSEVEVFKKKDMVYNALSKFVNDTMACKKGRKMAKITDEMLDSSCKIMCKTDGIYFVRGKNDKKGRK